MTNQTEGQVDEQCDLQMTGGNDLISSTIKK